MPDVNFDSIAKELYKKNLELHKERKRTEELLYRVSEAIYATDENCNITLFNHTLEKLLFKRNQDVLGKKVYDVINITDTKGNIIDLSSFCNCDENSIDAPDLAILKTPNKERYVHIKISVINTDQGYKEYLVTMSDVTREKELERAKDEFISITSHELRTPMTIIKSYIWMLTSGKAGKLNEKQMLYLNKAKEGAERMISLINDMLNVSRIEQGKIEFKFDFIEIEKLLNEIIEELKIKAQEKNLQLNLELFYKDKVFSDENKLREVIVNLVGNSIKYTDKGSVTVKVEKLVNDFVKISIIDTGRGIDAKEINKLFHKFQRLDNSYQTIAESGGTGLGLYIVKLYVGHMGGSVGVTSEGIGKGSTFWITIPTKKMDPK